MRFLSHLDQSILLLNLFHQYKHSQKMEKPWSIDKQTKILQNIFFEIKDCINLKKSPYDLAVTIDIINLVLSAGIYGIPVIF